MITIALCCSVQHAGLFVSICSLWSKGPIVLRKVARLRPTAVDWWRVMPGPK